MKDVQIDPDAITNILTLRYNPNINSKLPTLVWNDFLPKYSHDESETTEILLKNSIKNFVEQKKLKKTSFAISGGIDSVLSLSCFRELYPELKITCIFAGFDEKEDEAKEAENISNYYNCDFKKIKLENFLSNLPEQISIIKEPKWHYYWLFLAKEAKKYSNTLISGDGGDELFGGYVFRYKKFLELTNKSVTWKNKTKAYLECHNRDWVEDQSAMFGHKAKFQWNKIHQNFFKYFNNPLTKLEQVFLADYNGKLKCDWIPALNKIHKHLEIDGFSPFLNRKLIKFSAKLDLDKKYDFKTNTGKLPLRKILEKKKIKLNNSKIGFSPNLPQFWKNHGMELIDRYLFESRIAKDGWINQDWIIKSYAKSIKNNDIRYINKLLSILSFEIWYRLFITKEIKKSQKL